MHGLGLARWWWADGWVQGASGGAWGWSVRNGGQDGVGGAARRSEARFGLNGLACASVGVFFFADYGHAAWGLFVSSHDGWERAAVIALRGVKLLVGPTRRGNLPFRLRRSHHGSGTTTPPARRHPTTKYYASARTCAHVARATASGARGHGDCGFWEPRAVSSRLPRSSVV